MKYFCYLILAFCLQGHVMTSSVQSFRLEDNSIYFKKGFYTEFLNSKLDRIHELQAEHPGIVFEFSFYQLESEPRDLAVKRHKTLVKSFQQAGLDMNRIVFDTKTIYVKSFNDHPLYLDRSVLDSVGAILEGKVLSLE